MSRISLFVLITREGFANVQRIRTVNGSFIVTDMFALDVGPPKTYASCSSTVIYMAPHVSRAVVLAATSNWVEGKTYLTYLVSMLTALRRAASPGESIPPISTIIPLIRGR